MYQIYLLVTGCLQMSSNVFKWSQLYVAHDAIFPIFFVFPSPKNASEHVTFDQGQMKGQEMASFNPCLTGIKLS